MRLQTLSDLHLEFGGHSILDTIEACEADYLIMAGDIHIYNHIFKTLKEIQKYAQKPIIFVPGNHEYYYTQYQTFNKELKTEFKNNKDIIVLDEDIYEDNNIIFLGATGWWDGTGTDNYFDPLKYKFLMNDFSFITDISYYDWGRQWGRSAKAFFEKNIKKNQDKKIVCISHNGPTRKSIAPMYKGHELNMCFVNDWENLITDYMVDLWIHGHTHDSLDYTIGSTRIIVNPGGYYPHRNKNFKTDLVVEI